MHISLHASPSQTCWLQLNIHLFSQIQPKHPLDIPHPPKPAFTFQGQTSSSLPLISLNSLNMPYSIQNTTSDLPWPTYKVRRSSESRRSSVLSVAASSIRSSVSGWWRPGRRQGSPGSTRQGSLSQHMQQRRESETSAPTEKYTHVPVHAGADFLKTTTTPAVRRASATPAYTSSNDLDFPRRASAMPAFTSQSRRVTEVNYSIEE